MNIKTENAILTIEIDEKTISNLIRRHIDDSLFTIRKSGKMILTGKYGLLPFRIVANEIEYSEKQIILLLDSTFKISILSAILKILKIEDYVKTDSLRKELIINVEELIKSLFDEQIRFELVIEDCLIERNKITIEARVSGECNFTIKSKLPSMKQRKHKNVNVSFCDSCEPRGFQSKQ